MIRLLLACALLLGGCTVTSASSVPMAVRRMEFSNGVDRPLPTFIYQPPSKDGRHPVVVFSHGYTCHPQDYDALLRAWAKAGFIVAAPVFPTTARKSSKLDITDLAKQPADVRALITAVLALDAREGDPLYGRVDTGKVAVGGHSLGGMTSVGLVSSYARDKRVSAVVVLAGSARTVGTDYPDTDASMFFVHGDRDSVVLPSDGRAAYDPYRGRKAWLRLEYGDHVAPYFGTDRSDSLKVARATTDYLLWSLRGDIEALKRLNSTVDIDNKLS